MFKTFKDFLYILVLIFVFIFLNWHILSVYFLSPYVGGWDAMTHFSFAYYYSQNIFPSFFGWIPTWFSGMPFPQFYPPLFYYFYALIQHVILENNPILLFKIIVSITYFISPILLGYIYYSLIDSETKNYRWVIFFSFLLSSLDIRITGAGFGVQSVFNTGIITHAFSFIPFSFWIIFTYKRKEKRIYSLLSIFFLSLTLLSNVHMAVSCFLFFVFFYMEDMVVSKKLGFKHLLCITKEYFIIGFLSLCIVSFWYLPMINLYDFSSARSLNYPWGNPITFIIHYGYIVLLSIFILRKFSSDQKNFINNICIFSIFAFILLVLNVEKTGLPIHSDRQLSVVFFLFPIIFIYVTRNISKKFRIIIISIVVIFLLSIKFFPANNTGIKGMYPETVNFKQILEKFPSLEGEHVLVEAQTKGYPLDSLFNSYLGLSGARTTYAILRESSISSLFFTAIRNQFSEYPEHWGIRSRLSANKEFLNKDYELKLKDLKSIGVEYLLNKKDTYYLYFPLENPFEKIWDIQGWVLSKVKYEKQESPDFSILKYKPILVYSDFETKEYKEKSFDFINFSEQLLYDSRHEYSIVLADSKKRIDTDTFSFVFIEEEYLKKHKDFIRGIIEENKGNVFLLPDISDTKEFNNKNIIKYDSPKEFYYEEYYSDYFFALIEKNLIQTNQLIDYSKIIFEEQGSEIFLQNNTNEQVSVLVKRSYFPTWKAYSGQTIRLINPNFMFITLRPNSSDLLYFDYPNSFYWGHYISIIGIILTVGYFYIRKI